ncbi:MAG: iron-containing alcohol dehydrogenase [Sphaerochaetaceae bacterium]|nr:iron-containing alcohol dehydrogenase [Sphaerochaetaceae bacterium]
MGCNSLTSYYAPTKVTFGPGAENEIGKALKKEGATRVLVHYGSERIVKSGFLGKILSLIDAEGIYHVELGGVVPNPRLSLAKKGIELYKKENLDFILAIGGGSVIDSAKCIAYGTCYDGDVWDIYTKKHAPVKANPIGCILTMAAAGSEMSDSSVITNEDGNLKRGSNSDYVRLRFALENPELTMTLPPYQTSAAVVDIMMHTMERYFVKDTMPLTQEFAFSLCREVLKAGKAAIKTPDDYDARATIMWASSVSHNGFTALGNSTRGDWASHQIEHELSGMYDVAHGAGLAVIWPAWAKFVLPEMKDKIALFGYNVLGINPTDDKKADALKCIEKMEEFYKEIGMPVRISDMGINATDEELDTMAEKCSFFETRTVGDVVKLGKQEILEIYRLAR